MKSASHVLLPFALILVAASCSSESEERQPPYFEEARSSLARQTSPAVAPTDLQAVVAGDNALGLDLLRALREPGRNLMISPHSISAALAMAYAGARGTSESEMAAALRFSLPQSRLHPAMNTLDLALSSRGQGAAGKDGQPFRLRVVNQAWGQVGHQFEQSYLDTLALNYGAGLGLLDFAAAPEPSRATINEWVAYQTEDRIPELLPQGSISELTRLVLTNAVYFNAAWAEPFEASATTDAPFTLADGTQLSVPTMNGFESFAYAAGSDFQAVQLPYDGNELAMVAILPAGDLESFEDGLDQAKLAAITGALATADVHLSMPRFGFEWDASLKQALQRLGMSAPFSSEADFSGINGGREPLYVSDVIHKTFLEVDEAGTEAAAATAVILAGRGLPENEVVMKLDRPFLFLIRDLQTGAVLFLGRVVDPR